MLSKAQHTITELRERASRLTMVVILTLLAQIILVCMVLVFVYWLIGRSGLVQEWGVDAAQASQDFKPGQPATVSLETVTVYVPPFAIPLPGSIFMLGRERDPYPVAGQPEWNRPQMVEVQFRDMEGTPLPEIVLSAPIQICFKLTKTQWQDYAGRPGSFAIQYYGSKDGRPTWLNLSVAKYPDLLELCAQTDHLSLFALALKPAINIPITGLNAIPTPTMTPTQAFQPFLADPRVNKRERIHRPGGSIVQQSVSILVPTSTPQRMAASTSRPAATATRTPRATTTPRPTVTKRPATATQRPTAISRQATAIQPPTATSRPATATSRPPTTTPRPTATKSPPTAIPPTAVPPTAIPPTAIPPTAIPPTAVPPTAIPPTIEPATTEPPPTEPATIAPPPTEPPATEPPPPEPPPTEPPPTEPPATEPPPTEPPQADTPMP